MAFGNSCLNYRSAFNRTLEELKSFLLKRVLLHGLSFNRTLEELKCRKLVRHMDNRQALIAP